SQRPQVTSPSTSAAGTTSCRGTALAIFEPERPASIACKENSATSIKLEHREAFLCSHPVFARLSPDQRHEIAVVMRDHHYEAGTPIFSEGGPRRSSLYRSRHGAHPYR